LSKPNNWKIRIVDLVKKGPAGEYKIRQMLADANSRGYMTLFRITKEGNLFDWIWAVYESPSLNPYMGQTGFVKMSSSRFSTSGLSTSGKPRSILSTDIPSNNEKEDDDGAAGINLRYFKLYDFYVENISPKVAPLMKSILRNTAIDHEHIEWYEKAFEIMVKNGAGSWDYLTKTLQARKDNGSWGNGFEKKNHNDDQKPLEDGKSLEEIQAETMERVKRSKQKEQEAK